MLALARVIYDEAGLGQVLRTEARYVGVIGSRGKVGAICKHLREQGVPATEVERVRGPIGLSIGSRTPEEIAVSIAAELVAVRRGIDTPTHDP